MLERLELTDVTLVGLGFGGFIAAELATLNEDRLKALVLVGAAGTGPYSGYADATGALNSGPSTGISRPSATVFISICTCSPYPPELPIEKTGIRSVGDPPLHQRSRRRWLVRTGTSPPAKPSRIAGAAVTAATAEVKLAIMALPMPSGGKP